MTFWEMTYGEALKDEITKQTNSASQRKYFLAVYSRMEKFVKKYDEFLTFREYYDMYEKGN